MRYATELPPTPPPDKVEWHTAERRVPTLLHGLTHELLGIGHHLRPGREHDHRREYSPVVWCDVDGLRYVWLHVDPGSWLWGCEGWFAPGDMGRLAVEFAEECGLT